MKKTLLMTGVIIALLGSASAHAVSGVGQIGSATTSSNYADGCPSIDATIQRYNVGLVSKTDVENAILCKYQTCDLKISILSIQASDTQALYNVGLKTAEQVVQAQQAVITTKATCGR
jgi:hypothetical protein